MGFWLVPNRWPWLTLKGIMAVILRYFTEFGRFRGQLRQSDWRFKIRLYCLRQKCSPKNLVFSNRSFMAIFAEVTENECIIERHLPNIHSLRDSLWGLRADWCSPVLFTFAWPIWLRAEVHSEIGLSKQTLCSTISVTVEINCSRKAIKLSFMYQPCTLSLIHIWRCRRRG